MGAKRKYDKPMTAAQKQKEYEGRLKALGYKRVCFWVHETDIDEVKHAVAQIAEDRENTDG